MVLQPKNGRIIFKKNLEMMEHGIKKFLIVLNSQTLTLEKDLF